MTQKNQEKQERKEKRIREGRIWTPYYQRSTKSLVEKKRADERKHRANDLRKAMREAD